MSSRRTLNQTEGTSNPAKKYINWDSDEKCFTYYDKDLREKLLSEGKTNEEIKDGRLANVKIKLPIKFQFLEEFHTVKGFHEASGSGIYSNEVKQMKKEPVVVRSFKEKQPLIEGFYTDIKNEIKALGGRYGKSVYAILDGEVVNFQFYGASVASYMLFDIGDKKKNIKGHNHLLETNFIEVNDFQELKKGRTKYTSPIFTPGNTYTPEDSALADDKYKDIVNYFDKYTKEVEVEEEDALDLASKGDEGDLEF